MSFKIHSYLLFFSCLLLLAHNCIPHAHDRAEEEHPMDWLHLLFEGHSSLAHGQEEAFQFVEQEEEESEVTPKDSTAEKQNKAAKGSFQLLFISHFAQEQALLAKFLAQLASPSASFNYQSAQERLLTSNQAGRAPPIYG